MMGVVRDRVGEGTRIRRVRRECELWGREGVNFIYSSPQVYHTYFTPLEYTVAKRGDNSCYAKLICNKKDKVTVSQDWVVWSI